eukprot:CFRG0855T1
MVFSGWMAIGFAPWTERPGGLSGVEPIEGTAQYESRALEQAQNAILTAVAQRTPKDKQQARLQRLLGFSIGLACISAEPFLSHPFIVCRLQRQMHVSVPLCCARADPFRMPRHMNGIMDNYGMWPLYQGFGAYITMNVLSTITFLTVRGLLQKTIEVYTNFIEDDNDCSALSSISDFETDSTTGMRRRSEFDGGHVVTLTLSSSSTYFSVLSALLQRSISAMSSLPFYAASIVCLVRDSTGSLPAGARVSVWSVLLRRIPACARTGGRMSGPMIPLYSLALPFALTTIVSDAFEEFFTVASFARLANWILDNSNGVEKSAHPEHQHGIRTPAWERSSQRFDRSPLSHSPINSNEFDESTGDYLPVANRDSAGDDIRRAKDNTETHLAFIPDLISTFCGSLFSEALTYPAWIVLNRLIVQGSGALIVDTCTGNELVPVEFSYLGYIDCIKTIISEEGILGFYRGFSAFMYQYGAHLLLLNGTWMAYKYFSDIFHPPAGNHPDHDSSPKRSPNPTPWRDME